MTCKSIISDTLGTVGSLPAGFSDPLQPDGLAAFSEGLRVTTCRPTPSLGTIPPIPSTTSTTTLSTSPVTTPTTTTTTNSSTSSTTSSTSSPTVSCQSGTLTMTVTSTETVTETQIPTTCGPGGSNNVCIGGTGPGNFVGLCNFCCNYGYCPSGPCTCTQYGAPVPTPSSTGGNGVPLVGEGDSYIGLCSFACSHGYCPPTACKAS